MPKKTTAFALQCAFCANLRLFRSRAEPAVARFGCVVVAGDEKLRKNALRKALAFFYGNGLILVRAVCQLYDDVPLIIRIIIVRVDNAHGVVKLQTVLKPQPAARVKGQKVPVVYLRADARGNFHAFAPFQREIGGGEKIVTRAARSSAFR